MRTGDYTHSCSFVKLLGQMKDTRNFSATSIMQDHTWSRAGDPRSSHFGTNRHTLKIWVLRWKQSQEVSNWRMEVAWEHSLSYQNLLYCNYPKARPKTQQCLIIAGLQSRRSGRMWRSWCYSKKGGTLLLDKNYPSNILAQLHYGK